MMQSNPPAPAVPTNSPAPAPSDPLVPADPVPVSAGPRLVLLGSTGSIGVQTLDVVGRLAAGRPEGVSAPRVAALAAGGSRRSIKSNSNKEMWLLFFVERALISLLI